MSDTRMCRARQRRRHRSLHEDDRPLPRGSATNRLGRRKLTASSSRMLTPLCAEASRSKLLSVKRMRVLKRVV